MEEIYEKLKTAFIFLFILLTIIIPVIWIFLKIILVEAQILCGIVYAMKYDSARVCNQILNY